MIRHRPAIFDFRFPLSDPRARALARELGVFAFFVLAAVVMTWPLARNFSTAVSDVGDAYVSISILDWEFRATFHHPLSLFHQPIFHPARYTLAFTEHLYGISLWVFPLYFLGASSVAAYNAALLLGYALCGYGGYFLGRTVTHSSLAGLAGGVFFAFLPYRITQLPHLSYIWAGWLPLLLAALILYDRRPGFPRATAVGLLFFANGIACLHWFAMGSLAFGVTVILLWAMNRRDWSYLLRLGVTIAAAFTALLPFLLPYQKVGGLYGMTRRVEEAEQFSARLSDWLSGDLRLAYAWFVHDGSVDPERWLFPGVLPLVLAATGLILWWPLLGVRASGPLRQASRLATNHAERDAQRGGPGSPPSYGCRERSLQANAGVWVALLWIIIGFLGSLGLHSLFHSILFQYVRPFQSIRVPARWAMIAYVGLTILVSCGVAAMARARRKSAAIALSLGVVLLLLLEFNPAPWRWYLSPPSPPVYRWLRHVPIRGPVLELPISTFGSDYQYLYQAREHGRPLLNGVSSFLPPHYDQLVARAHQKPVGDEFLQRLEAIRCAFIVVHADQLAFHDASTREWLRRQIRSGRLSWVGRFPHQQRGDYVFALTRVVPEAAFLRPMSQSHHLERFLDSNGFTYWDATVALLDAPPRANFRARGELTVSGWAASPQGITAVNLLFRNAAVSVPAPLFPRPELTQTRIGYPPGSAVGFLKYFAGRPEWARNDADLIVEVVDGSGRRTRLDPIFFPWRETLEIVPGDWDPQALRELLARLHGPKHQRGMTERRITRLALNAIPPGDDRQFVSQCYRLLLGRGPEPAGLENHLSALRSGRSTRRDVVKSFIRSHEFRRLHLKPGL